MTRPTSGEALQLLFLFSVIMTMLVYLLVHVKTLPNRKAWTIAGLVIVNLFMYARIAHII